MKINFPIPKIDTRYEVKINLPFLKNLKRDTFERSNIIQMKNGNSEVTGEIVKHISLKDLNGKKVKGYIIKDKNRENQYFVCANGENQCRMIVSEDEDSLYVE